VLEAFDDGSPAGRCRGAAEVGDMRRILVVDDDPGLLDMVALILRTFDYTVATAGNGAEALERLRADCPDAVLLDLIMPVMDGWAFLRARRAEAICDGTPIVVMSARHDPGGALELGALALIRKPFDPMDLLATVRGLT
jgi:two-component system chemotaxis response regulator CheY